jgi:hypothetical protein
MVEKTVHPASWCPKFWMLRTGYEIVPNRPGEFEITPNRPRSERYSHDTSAHAKIGTGSRLQLWVGEVGRSGQPNLPSSLKWCLKLQKQEKNRPNRQGFDNVKF